MEKISGRHSVWNTADFRKARTTIGHVCMLQAERTQQAIETWVVGAWAGEVRRGGERKELAAGRMVYNVLASYITGRQPAD